MLAGKLSLAISPLQHVLEISQQECRGCEFTPYLSQKTCSGNNDFCGKKCVFPISRLAILNFKSKHVLKISEKGKPSTFFTVKVGPQQSF